MILADKIAQEIMGSEYFQSLFVICMERSYYQILNLCKSIQYKEKEYKDLLRFADLLSASSFSEARSYAYHIITCLLYTSPSPRDTERSRMPSSA